MSLPAHPLEPIPELPSRIAHASFPKGTLALQLRDALGPIYEDADFADLFAKRGRAAEAPWRLPVVTVLQALENLSDRQAAEMVRGRLDWKYALCLPLDDEGFDASILTDFRHRLVANSAQDRLLVSSAIACGQASKARFPKGCAVMGCAARASAVSQRRSCRPKPSRRPSTWCASVRCCNGRLWASHLGPSVLCRLLRSCDHAWRHDVRTQFPSRVIHTPVPHRGLDKFYSFFTESSDSSVLSQPVQRKPFRCQYQNGCYLGLSIRHVSRSVIYARVGSKISGDELSSKG